MRRATNSAIPPSLYRHFAIVTLALTAGLAMFAEGEGRKARTAQVAPPEPAAPATFAAAPQTDAEEPGGWDEGDGFDGSFGQAAGSVSSGFGGGLIPELEVFAAPGYSAEYLASLSEAEREMLLRGLQENGMLTPEVRRRRNAALHAASDRRSGASSNDI